MPPCCTQDFTLVLTFSMTHRCNATRAIVPCARAQTGISAFSCPVVWSQRCETVWQNFRFFLEPLPAARQSSSDAIRIPHVVSSCATTSHCPHLQHTTIDMTSGGGTVRLWWTMVVDVNCGVDEQIGVQGHETKEENLQTW